MHYIIYKTTNLINNKIYIGQHITNNLDDGYLGSGKNLHKAIKKYGKENFKKEILHIFDNFDDMDSKEIELVTEEFVKRSDTYNQIIGGQFFSNINLISVKDKNGNTCSMSKFDNRYINGEWVHHSKGKKSVTHKITGEKLYINIEDYDEKIHVQNRAEMKNEKNGNFKELTEEFKNILFDNVRNAVENNYVNGTNFMKIIIPISENFYHKKISEVFIKNKFGSFAKFIETYNTERNDNVIYEPYYRGFNSYKQMTENNKNYFWFTDGINNIRLKNTDIIPKNYYRGKTIIGKKQNVKN